MTHTQPKMLRAVMYPAREQRTLRSFQGNSPLPQKSKVVWENLLSPLVGIKAYGAGEGASVGQGLRFSEQSFHYGVTLHP